MDHVVLDLSKTTKWFSTYRKPPSGSQLIENQINRPSGCRYIENQITCNLYNAVFDFKNHQRVVTLNLLKTKLVDHWCSIYQNQITKSTAVPSGSYYFFKTKLLHKVIFDILKKIIPRISQITK